MKKKERVNCETCAFYVYDDEYDAYLCDMNMDEDDYVRIMSDRYYQCPYYRNGDEYITGTGMNTRLCGSRCRTGGHHVSP